MPLHHVFWSGCQGDSGSLSYSPVANRIMKLHRPVQNAAKAHLKDCH